MKINYSPKKAAMVLLDCWLAIGGHSPHWMDIDEMEDKLHDYGWKITEKRRQDIIDQSEKIMEPLRQRLATYIEKM